MNCFWITETSRCLVCFLPNYSNRKGCVKRKGWITSKGLSKKHYFSFLFDFYLFCLLWRESEFLLILNEGMYYWFFDLFGRCDLMSLRREHEHLALGDFLGKGAEHACLLLLFLFFCWIPLWPPLEGACLWDHSWLVQVIWWQVRGGFEHITVDLVD